MTPLLDSPIVHGIGLTLALLLLRFLLGRFFRRTRLPTLSYHAWAVSLGTLVALSDWRLQVGGAAWSALLATVLVLTAIVLTGLLDCLVLTRPWNRARGPLMPKVVRDLLRVAVLVVVGLTAATQLFNLSLPTALASFTLLSAAVGFALQDVLKNAFAGLALAVEKPFDIGDWLMVGDTPAQVTEMTWRSTRLRTPEDVIYHEPNANLTNGRVVNLGNGRAAVAFLFDVGLGYDAPPSRVKDALLEAVRTAPGVAGMPPPEVFLHHYGDSSVGYRIRAWTHEVHALYAFRDAVNARVWYQLQRAGLPIPFPIRTLHFRRAESDERRHRQRDVQSSRRLLAGVALFAELPEGALDALAAAAVLRRYDDGERLVTEGDAGFSLFVVAEGHARITKTTEGGGAGEVALATIGPGEFFGEMSLLTGAPRSATATAEGPCEALVLSREALAPLIESDPRLCEGLSRSLARREADQAATMEHRRRLATARDALSQPSLLARIRTFFGVRQAE